MVERLAPVIAVPPVQTATGERFIPGEMTGDIELEHIHRYRFAAQLVVKKTVLDIASGDGYGSAYLAQTARRVIGVDISAPAVEAARRHYQRPNLEFLEGSCSRIPLDDATVDVVVSFETIEHHAEHDAMMVEIKRVLRPRGFLIISTPDKLEYSDKPAFRNPFHVKELYREDFLSLLKAHFKTVRMFGQRVLEASALFGDRSSSGLLFGDLDAGAITYPNLPSPRYLLAVASTGAIPTMRGGLLEKTLATRHVDITKPDFKLAMLIIRTISAVDSKLLRKTLNLPWYLDGNPDIAAGRVDPYAHWMQHGAPEGRLPDADVEELARGLIAEREGPLRGQIAARELALRQAQELALARQREQAIYIERAKLQGLKEAEENIRLLAERERILHEKLLLQQDLASKQREAQQEAAEARLRTLTAQNRDREDVLRARIADLEHQLRERQVDAYTSQRQLEAHIEQVRSEARQELEAQLKMLADRETFAINQLLQQHVAHSEEGARLRESANQNLEVLTIQHHEREKVLLATIAERDLDVRTIQREFVEQRKTFESMVEQSRDAIHSAVEAERAALDQRLQSTNLQHRAEIEQLLRAMLERERTFTGDFSRLDSLVNEERRLLRAQYVAIVDAIRKVFAKGRKKRSWRRPAMTPTHIDSFWDTSRTPMYSLRDWMTMRKPALGDPNQNSQNVSAIAAESPTIVSQDVPGDRQEQQLKRANSRARSIEELLSWDGHDFITVAFLTFLGRKPDVKGYTFYLNQLRLNGDKAAIIRQIGESPEAKRRRVRLTGLRSFEWRQKWRGLPILGALVSQGESDPQEHQLHLILEEIEHAIVTLEQSISRDLLRFDSNRLPTTDTQINALFKSFNAAEYLAANPDVRAAGLNPFEHYMRSGWSKNRQWAGRIRVLESAATVAATPVGGITNNDTMPTALQESSHFDSRAEPATPSTEPPNIIQELPRWSCVMEPSIETPGASGPVITRFMQHLWRSRPDLQGAFDINDPSGRLGFLKWLAFHGIDELSVTARVFPRDLLEHLRGLRDGFEGIANELLEAQDLGKASLQDNGERNTGRASDGTHGNAGANLIGYAFGEFGMGEHARMMARSLHSSDFPFCIIDQDPGFHGTGDSSAAAWVVKEPKFYANVFLINADALPFLPFRLGDAFASSRYNIGFWAWELSQWPPEFDLALDMVDEVWAISDFVAQSVRTRARIPILTMHEAVTVPDLAPGYTKSHYGLPEDSFVFYFIFDAASHLDRKNPLAVVKAFTAAFPGDEPRVHLLLKTMNVETAGPLWDQLLREVSGNPRITILAERTSKEEVLGLNLACDAFISLHRSEGFGRCVAEAMAYGKPVIVTDYSGTRDFATADTACLVSYRLIPVPAGAYPFHKGQVWADPDIEHAASLMRRIASDEQHRTSIALAGQRIIRDNFNQEVMGQRYAKRLREIHELQTASSHSEKPELQEPSASATTLHGTIDSPTDEQCREVSDVLPVEGWVASLDPIESVHIYLDAAFVGDVHYGIPRTDVHAAHPQFPDAGRSGFSYMLSIAGLADGEHSFSVVATSRDGASRTWKRPFHKKEAFIYREWLRNTESLYAQATSNWQVRLKRLHLSLILKVSPAIDATLLTQTLNSLAAQQYERFELVVVLQDAAHETEVAQVASRVTPHIKVRFVVSRGDDWESIFARCRGDFIGMADPGDLFTPWAFRELTSSAHDGGKLDLVYADDDSLDAGSRKDPTFKPGWSPIFLETFNYIGRPWFASRTAFTSALGALRRGQREASEHELLRVIGQESRVVAHVPTVLVSRSGANSSTLFQIPPLPRNDDRNVATHWPKVSVIIPTRLGDEKILAKCFDGLERTTDYPDFEVIVLLNNVRDHGAIERHLAARPFRVLPCDGAFNWSKFNNIGAAHASGDLLLFMNDDVEPLEDHWLKALVRALMHTGAGVAGCLLTYPNGTIQHAGVHFVNYGGGARHLLRFCTGNEPGLRWLSHFPREVSAVTGACFLTTRACFSAMGGFDEDFALVCNDTDFCLRVWRSQMSVIIQPEARLIHHEGISRVGMPETSDVDLFWKRWGKSLERGDFFRNPNLDSARDDWTVNPYVEQVFKVRSTFVGGRNRKR
jgi:GT2 family glycosyltransferase/glycosyltransferase involved in cell wall biosynthesis/SAM-dependent methyltransferase